MAHSFSDTLTEQSAAKKHRLDADLARELKKEELRVQFAGLATDFNRWTKETAELTAAAQFGFDLPEVEAYGAVLEQNDAAINAEADHRTDAYTAVFNEAAGLGVRENVYTTWTLAVRPRDCRSLRSLSLSLSRVPALTLPSALHQQSLADARGALTHALQDRRTAYNIELKRQQENDALCKRFADLADPLSKWISEQKDAITKSKDDLEAQLANVEQRLASVAHDGANLAEISRLQDEIDGKGITTNRHTLLTAKDVVAQWGQWENFLAQKKVMLEEAIAHHKLRGITPEQYAEIEDTFRQFDKNSRGFLEAKELKATLYSLGEERGVRPSPSSPSPSPPPLTRIAFFHTGQGDCCHRAAVRC